MKRTHRRWQRLAWALLAPGLAAVLWLALSSLPTPPSSPDWPPALAAPGMAQGR